MTTQTFIKYDKEYLPGYTGHVPKKNEVFGCTAGDINRLINENNNDQETILSDYYKENISKDMNLDLIQSYDRDFSIKEF